MEIGMQNCGCKDWKADLLLSFVPEGGPIVPAKSDLDNACPWLCVAPALRDVQSRQYALRMVHGHPEGAIQRVLFVGLGGEDLTLDVIRLAVAKAVRLARDYGIRRILIPTSECEKLPFGVPRLVTEIVYAALLSLYRGNFLAREKTAGANSDPADPACLEFGVSATDPAGREKLAQTVAQAIARGRCAAEATLLSRTLANTPANLLSPADFARKAADVAKDCSLRLTVLDDMALKREGMNTMLAVGAGSVNPPRLIVLEHAPDAAKNTPPLVLLGKGICFDSGGISLKPAAKMHEMKSDMSGAAAVLAAMRGIAREHLPLHVVGILACAENLPDGRAVKPGDVITSMKGDTVEIVNTDAEGRLVLCDAITYARTHFAPSALIDIATLTGACAVALGNQLAGIFSTDQTLFEQMENAGMTCGEYVWRLPFFEGYRKTLKSEIADICHTGPRTGGAINAALFLKHFAEDTPYVHLDIAGVDWMDKGNELCPKGSTGFGARILLEFVRGRIA